MIPTFRRKEKERVEDEERGHDESKLRGRDKKGEKTMTSFEYPYRKLFQHSKNRCGTLHEHVREHDIGYAFSMATTANFHV